MRCFIATALFGVLLLATPAAAQFRPRPGPGPGGDAEQMVDGWYHRYLGRHRDAMGSVWVDTVRRGQPATALATILGSTEYYDKCGGTPEGFIQTLFMDTTGRPPSREQFQRWMQRLYQSSREDVAYEILQRNPNALQAGPPAGYYPDPPDYAPQEPNYQSYTRERDYEYRRPPYRQWR